MLPDSSNLSRPGDAFSGADRYRAEELLRCHAEEDIDLVVSSDLDPLDQRGDDALIEIPLNSRNKYEVDHNTGRIHLDRVLYSAMSYPTEYGIIENTLAPDGDPLDILVICQDLTFPGCLVPARVLGYLTMVDDGQEDYKLISVVDCDPRYDNVRELSDLPRFILDEISNFFQNYKVLQGVHVTTGDYHSKEETLTVIEECRQRYIDSLK